MSLNTFITNSMLIQNIWNIDLLFTDIKLSMNFTWNSKYFNILKGDLRPKLHFCFYDISLLTFLKRLTQSFVLFPSVFTKLWNYRILNSAWVTSYSRMKKKTFYTWFSLHIFVNFMKKETSTKFYSILDFFYQSYEITKFWMFKLDFDVSDVIHANDHM